MTQYIIMCQQRGKKITSAVSHSKMPIVNNDDDDDDDDDNVVMIMIRITTSQKVVSSME